jgi:hypothetical protein
MLSAYDFVIEHWEDSENPADRQSRWPEYELGYKQPVARRLATVSVERYNDLMPSIIVATASDHLDVDGTNTTKEGSQWKVVAGVLTYEGRIYVPAIDSLRGKVISLFHDIPESGRFGALMTTKLVSRDFYWPVMDSRVRKYVSGC